MAVAAAATVAEVAAAASCVSHRAKPLGKGAHKGLKGLSFMPVLLGRAGKRA